MSKKLTVAASEDAGGLADLYRQAAQNEQAEQAALDWIEADVDDCLRGELAITYRLG